MSGPEQETHCTEHQKTILSVNDLKNETGQLRKEVDEMWKRIQSFLTVGTFRWTVGILVTIAIFAVGANYKMQDSIGGKLDIISNKLSYIEGQASSEKNRTPGMVKQISL